MSLASGKLNLFQCPNLVFFRVAAHFETLSSDPVCLRLPCLGGLVIRRRRLVVQDQLAMAQERLDSARLKVCGLFLENIGGCCPSPVLKSREFSGG